MKTFLSIMLIAALTWCGVEMQAAITTGPGSGSTGGGGGAGYAVIPLSITTTNVAVGTVTNAIITYTLTCTTNVFIQNPSNSPTNGQTVTFAIKAVGHSVAWGSKYRWGDTVTGYTPSINTNKTDYIASKYNVADDKWDMTGLSQGF